MFKSDEQIKSFVDRLERFVLAVIRNEAPNSDIHEAVVVNKKRAELESFISLACNITSASNNAVEDDYKCPDCGYDMALRTNRQNGNKFYGCKKYPDCKGTRDENGLSRAEREEQKYKKEQVEQEGGFSFNRAKRNPVTEVAPEPVVKKDTGWVNPFAKK